MTSEVFNEDCMDVMRRYPDKYFDLAVVDPPYFSGPERRGFYGQKESKIGVHRDYPVSPEWKTPSFDYFSELVRVSKKYIVWGCNYFDVVFRMVALCGTNATTKATFRTLKSQPQTCLIASEYSALCGMECVKEHPGTGLKCKATRRSMKSAYTPHKSLFRSTRGFFKTTPSPDRKCSILTWAARAAELRPMTRALTSQDARSTSITSTQGMSGMQLTHRK